MNKLGLLFLTNNEKTSKNSSKSKNSISNVFGKTLLNNAKDIKFSKIMENSEIKKENISKTNVKDNKTEILKTKPSISKVDMKENLIKSESIEKKDSKLKDEETAFLIDTLANGKLNLSTGKIEPNKEQKKAEIEEKSEEKGEEKELSKDKKSLLGNYNENYNNAVLLSEVSKTVKKDSLVEESTELENTDVKIGSLSKESKSAEKENVNFNISKSNGSFSKATEVVKDSDEKLKDKGIEVVDETKENKTLVYSEIKSKTKENIKENIEIKEKTKGIKIEERKDLSIETKEFEKEKPNEKVYDKKEKVIVENNDSNKGIESKIYAKLSEVATKENSGKNEKIEKTQIKEENSIKNEKTQESTLKTENRKEVNFIPLKNEPVNLKEEKLIKESLIVVNSEEHKTEVIAKKDSIVNEKRVFKDEIKNSKIDEVAKKTEESEIKKSEIIAEENVVIKTDDNREIAVATLKEEKIDKSEKNEKVEFKSIVSEKNSDLKVSVISENILNNIENKIEIRNVEVIPQIVAKRDIENSYTQVENMIKMNFNADTKEMKLRLSPDDLGEVEVKISIEKNIMRAEFLVENEKVKEMLESRFTDLKNALLEKGISTSEINVNISGGNSQEKGYAQRAFYEELGKNNRAKIESKIEKNYVAAIEKNSAGYNRNLNGTLDITY